MHQRDEDEEFVEFNLWSNQTKEDVDRVLLTINWSTQPRTLIRGIL